ncbi:EAL domain-containing protein [Clostridium tagluense]|uniref:sensor domain-containing protein n=1 Tax=Clostridium tagluense TaxID=360422 RepID=UPI001CF3A6F8|nr:GGDEF domain-containing phosphodiesterase [Clostridium tagluense]MCB2310500.1 EAL domain-containing protein [Clostridium tagluense]MCB2315334.1 EAL domain-containing protein [Clostridium tagluense]MCB2320185.1 EAL domain-containing protein [Clostridium tagluense]MCB2325076.1 EAL domain-containing protein [Clostridium tagluense]MCB2329928.1 EAL domain-containing protein [Clostridium tagluense]
MNEKKIDLNKIAKKQLKANIELLNIDWLFKDDVALKNMPLKVAIVYALISGFWILFSDRILNILIENKSLMVRMQSIKGWSYALISSFIIYFLINEFTKKSKASSHTIKENYQEIQATYEQLIAAQEELRAQFDELNEKQAIIEKSEERYKLALEGANDAIFEVDLITKEFFSSDKISDITGYDKDDITSLEDLIKLVADEDRKIAIDDFNNHINGKTLYYQSSLKIKYNGGGDKWVLIRGKCLRNKNGLATKVSGSVTDISGQKDFENKINKLKYYDILTDIPNRKLFINTLESEIIKAKDKEAKHAVLFIDLDNFKEINDTLGHDYGDELLKNVAISLKASIREGDLVSRVGGDEFFILMRNIEDYSEISCLCEKLLSSLNCEISIVGKQVYTSASIGITVFPDDGYETNILLKNADTAMYSSKYNGKAKYSFFNKNMSDIVVRRVEIEKGLRRALEKNEFEIYYQPQIDIINNKIKGFEALLRWNSTELGKISPSEFIPVAEASGLIIPMGDWIIRTVYIQNNLWKSKGYLYDTIAINLSAVQLQNDKFEENLKRIITETEVNTRFVELEITESILMKDFEKGVKLLTEIRGLGINIALDDFGTGYSSLSYLKQLPINTLKIDKSFIDNIVTNEREKAIVDGIIQLAQKIELDVIAEGVETKEQIKLLQSMGCNQIQGYYFSKPLPSDEIEEKFLKTNWIKPYN